MNNLKSRLLLHGRTFNALHQVYRNRYDNRNLLHLEERGMYEDIFPNQASNDIYNLLKSGPQAVYAGFDPTASSLHVGNLLIIKHLLHWQRSGNKVHALIGTATAQIGDPSGRMKDREQQEHDVVREQGLQIQKNIEKIFHNHEEYFWSRVRDAGPLTPVTFVNNYDWYSKMNVINFLNHIGRHFRMGQMLLKDSVNRRISSDSGMCFTEFTYQIFQAFDWYYLYKHNNCIFQVGGKDQMGNIEAGHRLIKRLLNKPCYAFTLPIIANDAGDKFGKSAGDAVWLDPALTTPFDFYQFFMRLSDKDATKLYKLFSLEPYGFIENVIDRHEKDSARRIVQSSLAEELTLLVHGEEGLQSARTTTSILYSNNLEKLGQINPADLEKILPGCTIVECKFKLGYRIMDFCLDIRVFLTKIDAIRIIESGGFYINLQAVKNVDEVLSHSIHILPNKITLVRVGKKNYTIVKWIMDPM